MNFDPPSKEQAREFFENNYRHLRDQSRMQWMVRMFDDVIAGHCPRLVDLPTGAGKTELAVVWLFALAWYGNRHDNPSPVPRRLVWVVNRRVLVQQVFAIAEALHKRLTQDDKQELEAVRKGLRASSGESQRFFHVVELRGQIVANRDWAIRPTVPQLIIGTVDQIGSRLLFQGYGLGKWGRPQQAGLLGVDSWIAVDEAHLVPVFVLTLRQLRERCASPVANPPSPFDAIFARLPFWLTELSAIPGLPLPSTESPFRLTDQERTDPAIADRILASAMRRVQVEGLPEGGKPKEVLTQKLVTAALDSNGARITVFVREVGVANAVAAGLRKNGIEEDRICRITGRIRGYERDRLSEQAAFKAFRLERPTDGAEGERYFLIGTAAAEVGLDADADVILCDFASLPTLLQRLGRLDRRGVLSRRHSENKGAPPTMRIFTPRKEMPAKIQSQLSKLAVTLKADTARWSAELIAGTHWLAASKAKEEKTGEPKQNSDEPRDRLTSTGQTTPLIEAATWSVLNPTDGVCAPPKDWLAHDFAHIAAGPVVVPPVTDAVLDYWSATTEERSPHLSPHPFLYGLTEDDEGTPLVGVVFRLEVEALRQTASDEDDAEMPDDAAEVLEIFKRFPPLRAELHQVSLASVREWLASPDAEKHPFVYRDRDQWRAKSADASAADAAAALGPDSILVLPASVLMREPCKKILEDCEQPGGKDTAIRDVFDGVSDPKRARHLRTIEPRDGVAGGKGAWLWDFEGDEHEGSAPPSKPDGFQQRLRPDLAPVLRATPCEDGDLVAEYRWTSDAPEFSRDAEYHLPALREAAAKLRYMGRAEDRVECEVLWRENVNHESVYGAREIWRPSTKTEDVCLLTARPESTRELMDELERANERRAREAKRPARLFLHEQGYTRGAAEGLLPVHVAVFQIVRDTGNPDEPPVVCDAINAHRWRSPLRALACDIARDQNRWNKPELAEELISGHTPGGGHTQQPHLAFVPLPSLSFCRKADGRVRRFALLGYVESDKATDAASIYRTLTAALDGEEIEPGHRLQLIADPLRRDKVWPFYIRASRFWVSVTPLVIDRGYKVPTRASDGTPLSSNERHLRRLAEWTQLVRASLRHVRLPFDLVDSSLIHLTPSPFLTATERAERYRPKDETAPFVHARIEFSRPARGPLLVGDRRYLGLGLFAPLRD